MSALSTTAAVHDALDFAQAESNADDIVTLIVDHEVLVFGTDTTEIWVQPGTSDFPFARRQGNDGGWLCGAFTGGAGG